MTRPTLLIEVWKTAAGITVTTDYGGGGTRLCGVKLGGTAKEKLCEFSLDRDAVDAIVEDFDTAWQEAQS